LCLKESELSTELFNSWDEVTRKDLPNRLKIQREFGKKFLQREEVKPWDIRYLESKIAPVQNASVDIVNFLQPLTKLYSYFDFDLNKTNITFDVFPRQNKSEWGYQFTIIPGKDSRILANVDNKYQNYFVLLHEAGHAVHYNSIDSDDHILNDGISGIISEGIANLFGHMANQEIFFKDFFKENFAEAQNQFALLNQWSKMNLLSAVEPILFDHALYRQNLSSLDDINHLKTKMALELNGIENYGHEPNWAYLIHHTTHPIYLHNYFMGDITCEMLNKIFCEQHSVNDINDKPREFGAFLLNDVIRVSGRHPFEQLFEKISGRKFSLDLLID
jgi:oligoendopeptidase F